MELREESTGPLTDTIYQLLQISTDWSLVLRFVGREHASQHGISISVKLKVVSCSYLSGFVCWVVRHRCNLGGKASHVFPVWTNVLL